MLEPKYRMLMTEFYARVAEFMSKIEDMYEDTI